MDTARRAIGLHRDPGTLVRVYASDDSYSMNLTIEKQRADYFRIIENAFERHPMRCTNIDVVYWVKHPSIGDSITCTMGTEGWPETISLVL